MKRPIVAMAVWLLFQSAADAQIPEAPGHGGVAPRDEAPDEIQAPVPAVAPPVPTVASKKPSAHDTVETKHKARANAEAEAAAAPSPTQTPKARRRHHKH